MVVGMSLRRTRPQALTNRDYTIFVKAPGRSWNPALANHLDVVDQHVFVDTEKRHQALRWQVAGGNGPAM